jgi:glutamate-ammonia-ligase adenylyltransferase
VTVVGLDEAIERSAAPVAARLSVRRLVERMPGAEHRLRADQSLALVVVAVVAASRHLALVVESDPAALDVLSALDVRRPVDASSPAALARWKALEELRLAGRDLLDLDPLPVVVAGVSAMGRDVLAAAHALVGPRHPLAIIGMGKLGAGELNYASDIDVVFVGDGDAAGAARHARGLMDVARLCFRVDANLRPQGRDGPLVRTLESFDAYWQRWAEPWEFQALLKARPVAGDPALGEAFAQRASEHLWNRSFSADDIRSLRHLKARTEDALARRGISEREVKRGRGGLRDIEFAVQLLQLVHGRFDPALRTPATLDALAELATAGYVDADDAAPLADAYRFLRRLEHRLQLYDGTQTYAVPVDDASRTRLARTMGFRDAVDGTAVARFEAALTHHQHAVRSVHERLYFRPLLEAFSRADPEVLARPGALEARASAFGFADSNRTRAAVEELTRGLTRSSRLMQQILPLLLGWLAEAPDPDLGLLCLRNLVGARERAEELARAFRESPEAARRLCLLVGTSRLAADTLQRNPDLVARLPFAAQLGTRPKGELVAKATAALSWRKDDDERQAALLRWTHRNLLGVIARDVLGDADLPTVGRDLTALAEAALQAALTALDPRVPFAVMALGRFGGAELSYASDLDVVFVHEGSSVGEHEEALRLAAGLRRAIQGPTPATRLWVVDAGLRPEGKQGPLSRSVDGYRSYFERWALVWERQAMMRARPVAGDAGVATAFMALLDDFVWAPGLTADDVREIRRIKARVERERLPAGDDPQFHLKLGHGALADVEWTVQLLQLQHRVRGPGTIDALGALVNAGALDPRDSAVLAEAYRFCESTRDRLFLVRSAPGDALPRQQPELLHLARAQGTSPVQLREQYRKVTRRARAVVERLFYGRSGWPTS